MRRRSWKGSWATTFGSSIRRLIWLCTKGGRLMRCFISGWSELGVLVRGGWGFGYVGAGFLGTWEQRAAQRTAPRLGVKGAFGVGFADRVAGRPALDSALRAA